MDVALQIETAGSCFPLWSGKRKKCASSKGATVALSI
jgi:hypothetical protein